MNLPMSESRPSGSFVPTLVILLFAPLACFKPDDDGGDEVAATEGESGTDDDDTSTGDVETGDSTSADPTDTDSTDSDPTDTDSTTGDPPACNDGNADPGELCLATTPTESTLPITGFRMDYGRFGLHPGIAVVGGPNAPMAVAILPGKGDRTFEAPQMVALDSFATSIDVDDMDDDGDHDLVTSGGLLCSRMNDGMGGWEFPDMLQPAGGVAIGRVQLGQFDGNAPLDAVWAEGYNTRWARGNAFSGWTFGTEGWSQFTGGDFWVEVTEWGFDGDGFTDLAVTSQWEAKVSITRGMGNATFTEVGQVPICEAGSCDITELHVDDVDGDDNPDLIASFADGISVVLGNDDGTFGGFELHAFPGADYTTSGDVDNDGDVDLLVASATTGDLGLFLGDGTGAFAEPMIFATPSDTLRTAAMFDLDEDGAKELVTVYNYDGAGWVGVFEATP
ncbi:FG-GAP-like repeat-containing protein [Nannocystaceae bacterium ST9]